MQQPVTARSAGRLPQAWARDQQAEVGRTAGRRLPARERRLQVSVGRAAGRCTPARASAQRAAGSRTKQDRPGSPRVGCRRV